MFAAPETNGPDVGPRDTAALQEYVDAEHAGAGRTLAAVGAQLARYSVLRFGTLALSLPIENTLILRQVQYLPLTEVDGEKSDAGPYVLCLQRRESIFASAKTAAGSELGGRWLWRGLGAAWAHAGLRDLVDVTVDEALGSAMAYAGGPSAEDTPRGALAHALAASAAQGVAGVLLAPLEIVRIRKLLVRDDNAAPPVPWRAPHALFTFASSFLRPLLRAAPIALANSLLVRTLFRSPEDARLSPALSVAWLIVQHALLCAPLLLTLPMDTVRRRLYAQDAVLGASSPVVRLAPSRYTSATDCARRVCREEGISALYQGWGVHVAATTASFLAAAVADLGDDADFGADF